MGSREAMVPMRFTASGDVTTAERTQLGLSVGDNRRRHERGVRIASLVILRGHGKTINECAKILDISTTTVKSYLQAARREELLPSGLEESIHRLRNEIVVDAVENVGRKIARGHLDSSFKVLEGVGAFTAKLRDPKAHAPTGPPPQVNIQIVNAPGDERKSLPGGTPNR